MYRNIDPKDLRIAVSDIAERWMLITAGTPERCNTMTASWGAVGELWGVPMATIYIRPQRYTKEFVDQSDYFTLCFFPEDYRKELALCGAKSGRDIDKVKACGFTVAAGAGNAPYFQQAELVLVCRKRYVQRLSGEAIPEDVRQRWYDGDYHYMYFGEIIEVLEQVPDGE